MSRVGSRLVELKYVEIKAECEYYLALFRRKELIRTGHQKTILPQCDTKDYTIPARERD